MCTLVPSNLSTYKAIFYSDSARPGDSNFRVNLKAILKPALTTYLLVVTSS